MKKAQYFGGLDLLRFFAAFWVMCFHYFFGLTGALSFYRYGNLGVPLFFIISGFVISKSIAAKSVGEFAIDRFIRLFPLFWIICTTTYIFTLLMPNGNPVSFVEYLISMSLTSDKIGAILGYPRMVDPVYWSLLVEILFYIAIALFTYYFSWKRIRYFLWGWLTLSALSFLFHIEDLFLIKMFLVRHASYFIFGATAALIYNLKEDGKAVPWYDYALIVITAVYSSLISKFALPPYFVINKLDTSIVMWLHPIFFLGSLSLLYLSRYITSKKVIIFTSILGGITYPLYLLHQTIGMILIHYFEHLTTPFLLRIICMTLMISISYLFYKKDILLRGYLKKKFKAKELIVS